jgi:ADP-ribose pyrophosphatase
VLIEQFRVGALAAIESGHVGKDITPWLIECAAGIIEDGETPEEVARREVREETGCDVLDIVPALQYLVSPGGTSETIHVFCAHVTAPEPGSIHGIQEEHEDIRVLVVPVAEAFEWLRTGVVINAMTLIALHWFRDNHAGLRQQWKE